MKKEKLKSRKKVHMETSRQFYVILVAVILALAIIIGVVLFEMFNIGQTSYGPGPVDIEVTTDKPSYLQGEEIRFSIHINNQQDWPVPYPSTVIYHIIDSSYYLYDYPTPPFDVTGIPAHHRTFYYIYVWDQKVGAGNKRTPVEPGNYTFNVSFDGPVDYGDGANCTIEIQ